MNRKLLAFAWVVCIIFTWLMIAILWASWIFMMPGGSELDFMELISQNLTSVTFIVIALIVGSIGTPCCYCQSQN